MNYKKKILPIFVFAVLSGGLSGCSKDQTSEEYLNSASAFLQQGKNTEAIINLKNLLKNDSTNADGRFLLGKAYAQQGNWLAAEKELTRVVKQFHYDQKLFIPLLAQVYFKLHDSAALEELLVKQSAMSKKLDVLVMTYLAMVYVEQGSLAEAKELFEKVTAYKIDSPFLILSKAYMATLIKDSDSALETLEELSTSFPSFPEAKLLKAQVLFGIQQASEAAIVLNDYLQTYQHEHKTRMLFSEALIRDGQFTEAEKQADFLLQINPKHAWLNQIKAQVKFAEKNHVEAKKYAEMALINNSNLPLAHLVAGVSSYQLGQIESAHMHLVAIKERLSYKHPAKQLLASIRLQLGYKEEFFQELSEASLDELDTRLLYTSAMLFLKQGDKDEANTLMEKAALVDPENSHIIYKQGVIKLLSGDDSSIDFFKRALEKDPNLDAATTLLVTKLISDEKYDEAIYVAKGLEKENIELSYSLRGIIHYRQKNLVKAKKYFFEVLAINENHVGALINLASISENEKMLEKSVEYYFRVLSINNDHIPAITELLKLSTHPEVQSEIENYFVGEYAEESTSELNNIVLLELYIANRKFSDAHKLLQKSLKSFPDNIKFLLLQANVYVNEKKYDEAIVVLDHVIAISPSTVVAYAVKANIYNLKKNFQEAIEIQKQAIELLPQALTYKVALIKLYIKNNNVNAAKEVIKQLNEIEKNDINVLTLQGKIAFKERRYNASALTLLQVYNKQPSEQVLLELLKSLRMTNEHDKAFALLENLENLENTRSLSFRLLLEKASLYSDIQPKKTIAIYKSLANQTNNHFVILNNLAWEYLKQGDNIKALENAKAALSKAPQQASVLNTYGQILLASGQKTQSIKPLQKAMQINSNKASYKVDYAESLVANMKIKQAQEVVIQINVKRLDKELVERIERIKSM